MYYSSGGDIPMYAKGGLSHAAHAVRGAGRYGDTELVHVNKDEMADLRRMWGDPTTNPDTGMPEFFLGGILKKLLPIAVSFIPGVGPVASAALQAGAGAAAGALDGGGLKGALSGAVGGALGAPGVGGQIGSGVGNLLGNSALARTVGDVVGGTASAMGGSNLSDADRLARLTAIGGTPATGPLASASATPQATSPRAPSASPEVAPRQGIMPGDQPRPRGGPMQPEENWFSRNSIIKGIPNGLLVGGALSLLPLLFRKNEDDGDSDIARRISTFQQRGYAMGGYAEGGEPQDRASFAVSGPGDGRSDEIPAQLSDGEYVIDAETVALLGNGSTKAGAKRLDDFRVNIRKHKGRKLARGEFSHDAKPPERYMRGGLY